jgi:hypothetical protein
MARTEKHATPSSESISDATTKQQTAQQFWAYGHRLQFPSGEFLQFGFRLSLMACQLLVLVSV